jgi:hypothetical protein
MKPNNLVSPESTFDHALLVAGAAVNQASTPTAELAGRIARRQVPPVGDGSVALTGLFAAAGGHANDATQGSFHPRIARATAGKAPSTLMKPGFTLAF